jgi:hypothetical protein
MAFITLLQQEQSGSIESEKARSAIPLRQTARRHNVSLCQRVRNHFERMIESILHIEMSVIEFFVN